MFIALLLATVAISLSVCLVAILVFSRPVRAILERLITDEINRAWLRYIKFAVIVVGIAGGVDIRSLERYIDSSGKEALQLTGERWALELLDSVKSSLAAITWMLLVFFIFALLAFVALRIFELRKTAGEKPQPPTPANEDS